MWTFGYLDAGSGSMLLQAIAGGLAGLAVLVRYRWHSIRQWMKRGTGPGPDQ